MASHLEELSREASLALLAQTDFGRVGVATEVMHTLVIRPVNYIFDAPSQSVVFRTARGSKFHALVHATRACFEIDGVDRGTRSGWSVIITGMTEEVTNIAEIRRLAERDLEPWAWGAKPHWIRIRARVVSGRRVRPDSERRARTVVTDDSEERSSSPRSP